MIKVEGGVGRGLTGKGFDSRFSVVGRLSSFGADKAALILFMLCRLENKEERKRKKRALCKRKREKKRVNFISFRYYKYQIFRHQVIRAFLNKYNCALWIRVN